MGRAKTWLYFNVLYMYNHNIIRAEDDQPLNMTALLRISLGEDRMTFMLNVKAESFLVCSERKVKER